MAEAYRTTPPGRVALVLGAGNASSIGPLDVIHKLVVERQVVVLKLHPVMAHLADVYAAALAPLVDEGVLRIVHGDAVQGGHLATHPGVDTLHITGSDRTYDAIVYGPGAEGEARRRRDDPILAKPFTAELGNLTPIIVVPGRWSGRDLDVHADNIATMLTNNAGFNCTSARVIVTAAGWPQREALLDRLRARLGALPTRLAYYPGAAERFAAFGARPPRGRAVRRPARRPPAVDAHPGPLARRHRRPVLHGRGVLQHHRRDADRRAGRGDLPRAGDRVRERARVGHAQRHADRRRRDGP